MASQSNDGTGGESDREATDRIRETYDEYGVGGSRFALIGDPKNEHAWIQSDRPVEIER